jgi:hypothetical protein
MGEGAGGTLREIVATAPELFAGAVREDADLLRRIEADLGIIFPEDVRWFLTSCGSGHSNAIPNIEEAARDTLSFRAAVALPHHYLVLDDMNDAGTVFLDTSSTAGTVLWVAMHSVRELAAGLSDRADYDRFESFADWVAYCVSEAVS